MQLARFYINFYSCQWVRYLFSFKITELEGTEGKSFGFVFVWTQSLRPKGWGSSGAGIRLRTGRGVPPSVVSRLTSVQTTLHVVLSAQKPLCKGAGERARAMNPLDPAIQHPEVVSELDLDAVGKPKVSVA